MWEIFTKKRKTCEIFGKIPSKKRKWETFGKNTRKKRKWEVFRKKTRRAVSKEDFRTKENVENIYHQIRQKSQREENLEEKEKLMWKIFT